MPRWDKWFNVNGDYVEVWCVPSAVCVQCIHRSQNNVLSIRSFLPRFLKLLWVNYEDAISANSTDWWRSKTDISEHEQHFKAERRTAGIWHWSDREQNVLDFSWMEWPLRSSACSEQLRLLQLYKLNVIVLDSTADSHLYWLYPAVRNQLLWTQTKGDRVCRCSGRRQQGQVRKLNCKYHYGQRGVSKSTSGLDQVNGVWIRWILKKGTLCSEFDACQLHNAISRWTLKYPLIQFQYFGGKSYYADEERCCQISLRLNSVFLGNYVIRNLIMRHFNLYHVVAALGPYMPEPRRQCLLGYDGDVKFELGSWNPTPSCPIMGWSRCPLCCRSTVGRTADQLSEQSAGRSTNSKVNLCLWTIQRRCFIEQCLPSLLKIKGHYFNWQLLVAISC